MRGMLLACASCIPASGVCVQRQKSTMKNRGRSDGAKKIGLTIVAGSNHARRSYHSAKESQCVVFGREGAVFAGGGAGQTEAG